MTIKNTQSRYFARGYRVDRYDRQSEMMLGFKDADAMWKWCREFLAEGNRKVEAFARRPSVWRGMRKTTIRKIGVFSCADELPNERVK